MNECSRIQFQEKTYPVSLLQLLGYGVTSQTLKKTDEIGIDRIVSTWPVHLFTKKTIDLHVFTCSKKKKKLYFVGGRVDF